MAEPASFCFNAFFPSFFKILGEALRSCMLSGCENIAKLDSINKMKIDLISLTRQYFFVQARTFCAINECDLKCAFTVYRSFKLRIGNIVAKAHRVMRIIKSCSKNKRIRISLNAIAEHKSCE